MMLIFLSYAIGVEVSRHICVEHQFETIALYTEADCPCEHHHKHNDQTPKSGAEATLPGNCCDAHNSHHPHSSENPEFSDDCCMQVDNTFSLEDSYTQVLNERVIHSFTVMYYLPLEEYTYKTNSPSNEILNLARDDINQVRRSIIQFLHRTSNPNKSDDLSISLA